MNIALIGYGKMGRAIEQVIAQHYAATHRIVCRIGAKSNAEQGVFTWHDWVANKPDNPFQGIDIAIEFSRPEAVVANLLRCFEAGLPVVCGTTAWHEQLPVVQNSCEQHKGSLLYASNFSLSVNILFALNRQLASYMHRFCPDYQLQIDEIHHTQKLDAPSGTAIALAQGIMAHNPDKKSYVNQVSAQAHEIAIVSHRQAHVPGTHSIAYWSPIDSISLQHIAYSREGFAQGAVMAAQWLQGKKGIFTMADVINTL
jgi:4-hydroxy-tetrahydrodipicolinate reductase